MKKICLILITVMLSSFLNVYADAPAKFEGKDTLNIVYFGGSITVGSGATSDENTWRSKVGKWFAETYPGTTVNNYSAGIGGTGTELGYYRANKDVLAHDPDIVFVEFAVNDRYKKEQEAQFLLESIIRGFQKSPSNPYVILIYTSQLVNEEYKDASEYQKKIAEYYNIPDIDLQPVIEEYLAVEGNVAKGGFFSAGDTVHPSDIGYALYSEKIIECLETGDYFKTPDVKETSYVKINHGIDAMDCALPGYDLAYNNDAYKLSKGDWIHKTHWQHGDYVFTNKPGATMEYKFSGPVIGMFCMVSHGGGKLKMELDGVEVDKVIDTYYKLSSDPLKVSVAATLHYDNKELSDGEHTLKLTVLDEINPNNQIGTTDVSIYGFYTSDSGTDTIGKMSVSDVSISNTENVVEAKVENAINTSVDVIGMLTVYDSNGKLVGVNQVKKTFIADTEETFEIDAIVPDEENAGCKLYMWDNDFTPIYISSFLK